MKRELALIESLGDMEIANEITITAKAQADDVHLLDRKFAGLGLDEVTPGMLEILGFSNLAAPDMVIDLASLDS